MAIEQATETLALTSEERTFRINIETQKNANPTILIYREVVKSDPSGAVVSKTPAAFVSRSLAAVATETVQVGSSTISVGDLATAIAALADTWRHQDLANPSVPVPKRPGAPPMRDTAAPVAPAS